MIRKNLYILAMICGTGFSYLSAQNSQTLYYMNIPQNHLLNPAMRPSNSLYIGLPVISGVDVNLSNNFVNFSDVIIPGKDGSIISFLHPDYNVDDFLVKIKNKNSISPQLSVQLFGLGFSAGENSYVFLDINTRAEGNVVLPRDIFELALRGNEGFVGSRIDLSSLRCDLKIFHEVGLGFSRNYSNKLRIGIRGKLLLGVAAASIDNRSFGISVNDDYSHTLDADMTINISGPLEVEAGGQNNVEDIDFVFHDERFDKASDITSFLLDGSNTGLGLDIGGEYDVSDKLTVSAAVTDIGYIRWKRDISSLEAVSNFAFNGVDMVDFIDGTKELDELGKEMLELLEDSFTVSDSRNAFTTWLPLGITLGGSYCFSKSFSLGILSYSRIIGKQYREALTLSANVNLGNALSTTVSYTTSNHRYDNFGAGLAFRAGIVQLFFMADRIPVMWNKVIVDDGSTIPLPESWNTVNLRLGMNLVFGNRIKEKDDKPMVIVE